MGDRESVEQTYYPAVKARLIIRLEEFGKPVVAAKAPKKLVHRLKGTVDSRGALTVSPDPTAPAGISRFTLEPASGQATGGPQKEDASADKLTWVVGGIIPKEASWKQNGIRSADELKMTLKFLDLPFDPRVIRSAAVEYYMGTLREEDYRAGLQGQVRSLADRNGKGGEGMQILPDQWVDESGRVRTNLRFQGWVDEWEINWPQEDEAEVNLTCRDNTKVLIDQDAPPKLVIAASKPIDEGIATYLSNFPQFAGLSVEYRPAGVEVPKLGPALAKTAYNPKLGPIASKGGGAPSKLSVWDYLTDVTGALGHVIRMDGTTVIIQRARTIMSNDAGARPDDPFQERTSSTGLTMARRHFIYGRNILEYKVARRYAKTAPTNVEVRCYNGKRKKVLVARFPVGNQSIVTDVNPGDGHSEQKVMVWRVSGIEDEKTLRLVAQSIYETVGRNELAVTLQTKNLASFGAGNLDPDVLDAKPGDGFEVLVNRDEAASLTEIEQNMLLVSSAREFLEAAGYSGELASAYAKAYSDAAFQSTFRLRDMSADWSIDDGVSISFGGVNYVEIRADKVLPDGEEVDGAKAAGAKASAKKQPGTT